MVKDSIKRKNTFVWCDYCNTHINVPGVRACLRKDCKPKVAMGDKLWKVC